MGNGESDPLFTILGGHFPYQILPGCTKTWVLDQTITIWYGIENNVSNCRDPLPAVRIREISSDAA